eukprot:TRINITY_DN12097_c0_g1_i1.p1 TRINITY_DN12097_c0_g1~~TRINITY_DN12097_c0_g1_i1.p1  ORF type:complete len:176 (+),score=14.97 TRINITY_DN12097_c0_g1_i1:39-566(+)
MAVLANGTVDRLTTYFCTKLVRKDQRVVNPFSNPGSELCKCVIEFRELVSFAISGALKASDWETSCESFSNKWMAVSHWICPVRLLETISEDGSVSFLGKLKERRNAPPQKFILKKKRANGMFCKECGVLCNSSTQFNIHLSGMKHKQVVKNLMSERSDDCIRDILTGIQGFGAR